MKPRSRKILRSRKRKIPKRTLPGADVVCPKCKRIGQEKYRRRKGSAEGTWYLEIDHYAMGSGKNARIGEKAFHNKYVRSCYIGLVTELPKRLQSTIPLSAS